MNRLKSIVKKYFPLSARSWLIFVAAMASASALCAFLQRLTTSDTHVPMIFVLAVLVGEAIKSGELLAADGIDARIINIHTIKPIDKELMLKASRETGRILTCEEHSVIGGLGAAVMEAIAEEAPCKVSRLGVNDQYGHSGPGAKLLGEYGFTAENIAARAKEMLK